MNLRLVIRVLSILLLIIGFFMLFPMAFALYYREFGVLSAFAIPILAIIVIAGIVHLMAAGNKRTSLSNKDGFLLVALSWVVASALGALPFTLSGAIPSYTDAYFETMSGFTTTGASILTSIESLPMSILFWRSLTHWLGGMGIVVLTVAILPLLGIGALKLVRAEAPGPSVDKLAPKITETAKILWLLYVGLSALETALLMLGGMSLFDALTHTFGTMATGGFSPRNASVGAYDSAFIHIVITVFMLMAGINFVLYYKLLTAQLRDIFINSELKAYLAIFFASMAVIAFNLHRLGVYATIGESLRYAGFQAASILTTTGYATADFEAWPELSKVVLFILMFIGGCAGSTGGGPKVVRIVTLFKMGVNEMKYLLHPHAVFSFRVNGQFVRKEISDSIAGFFFLYVLCLIVTTFVVATGGYDIVTSFTTSLVTVGNIGPGFGKIGPAENYAFFPDYIKWVLSLAMMVGRLEVYTVLILLTPRFWKR